MRGILATTALALAAVLASAAGAAAEPTQVAHVRLVDALPPSPSVAVRLDEIRRRIEDALAYPALARAQEREGEALLEFEIDAQGRAAKLDLRRSSGHWLLDRAAEDAVREAAPLPYVWGRLEVPVRFDLSDRRRGRPETSDD